jgi:hypothetical protein
MTQPQFIAGITYVRLSQWIWRVSLDGKWVGTVNGDSVIGFTARDVDYQSIGGVYVTPEAAMQAWAPAVYSHH